MRQAQDSEIIRLSMDIREGKTLTPFSGNEARVFSTKDFDYGMLFWADQIICAKNETRHEWNAYMRKAQGHEGSLPEDGDKLICNRNYWEDVDNQDNALVNGTIGYLKNPYQTTHYIPYWAGGGEIKVTGGQFVSDIGTDFGSLSMDTNMILTGKKCMDYSRAFKLEKNIKTRGLVPKEFEYGYLITCHRAQGSEWPKVMVIEEGFPWRKEEHKQWLYTAITRASEKLILVLNH